MMMIMNDVWGKVGWTRDLAYLTLGIRKVGTLY